jgi:4-hydroxybenzoate polyprenyltransferase
MGGRLRLRPSAACHTGSRWRRRGARNAANALNRVIDAHRRQESADSRAPPAGRNLVKKSLLVFSALMGVIVVVAAALLNPLCVALLPVAAILIGGYSYTKRFTWLCHYWLGVACAAAPMGAFLALSGRFEFRYFVLAGAVALWVAGFDILYALQDIDFDRTEGILLHSGTLRQQGRSALSALSHLGTAAGLAALPCSGTCHGYTLAGIVIAAALLASQNTWWSAAERRGMCA